jgi:hypothetical protein
VIKEALGGVIVVEKDKTFTVYDSTVSIWRLSTVEDWETHEALRMLLVRRGFSFHQDPQIKKNYPILAKSHYHGVKRDLHFYSAISGRHTEFTFYEDVVRDNPNGGRYHFDKLDKMPYLLRKLSELEIGHICRLLVSMGFTDQTKPTLGKFTSDEMVKFHRGELSDFQGKDFYTRERYSYNINDRQGNSMNDGDTRYFWTYTGRLSRGTVYHNINNMWWVVVNRDCYSNEATHNLFTWRPEMGRKRKASIEQIKNKLQRFVKEERFESACVLRDAIRNSVVASV